MDSPVPNALKLLSRKSAAVRGGGVCVPRARAEGRRSVGIPREGSTEAALLQRLQECGCET